jgi:hypothetical protein
VAAALVCAAAACRTDQGPRGGELSVRLAIPRTSDRAVLFTVVGPQRSVSAPPGSGYRVLSQLSADGDTSHIVVVAPAGSGVVPGEIARVEVPDLDRVGSYVAVLGDVATDAYAVGDTAGVTISLVRP